MFQAIEDEFRQHQQDLDAVNDQADNLRSKGSGTSALPLDPEIVRLNDRWRHLRRELADHQVAAEQAPTSMMAVKSSTTSTTTTKVNKIQLLASQLSSFHQGHDNHEGGSGDIGDGWQQ